MKKIKLYSTGILALMAFSSALAGGPDIIIVEPNYFNGFYVGGTGALHYGSFSGWTNLDDFSGRTAAVGTTASDLTNPIVTINSFSDGVFDGYGGVQGGFGRVFRIFNQKFYAGIQGFGEFGSQEVTSTVNADATNIISQTDSNSITTGTSSETSNTSTTISIDNDYGAAFKLGYLIAPTTLLYTKIGVVWAEINVSSSFSDTTLLNTTRTDNKGTSVQVTSNSTTFTSSGSSSDTKSAVLLGGGLEQYIYKDMVSLDIEYTYAHYGTVKTSSPIFESNSTFLQTTDNGKVTTQTNSNSNLLAGTMQTSGTVNVSTLSLGLNVYFGKDWI